MKEVFRTNEPVRLSFAEAVLKEAGIGYAVLDEGTSSLLGGGLPFIQRRVIVEDSDEAAAKQALADAFADKPE